MPQFFGPVCTPADNAPTYAFVEYVPNVAATYAYLVIFAVFLIIQLGLGLRYKTWFFCGGLACGLLLEIIGYVGRILLRSNPCSSSVFLMYFIPLGLGPAFMTASIYITLGHLINLFGVQFSRFLPRTYTCVFVSSDVFALAIQAVGGALTAQASTNAQRQTGVNILITGLSIQAAGLLIFLGLGIEYGLRVRRSDPASRNPEFAVLRAKSQFRFFIWAVVLASLSIFTRCIYRVVELSDGFSGPLANDEITFLILEGPMIMIAMLALSIFHPGHVFHGDWKASQFKWRPKQASKRHNTSFASAEISPEKLVVEPEKVHVPV